MAKYDQKKLVSFTCPLHKRNSRGAKKPYRNTGKRAYFKIYLCKNGMIRCVLSHGNYCIDIAQQSLLTAILTRALLKPLCYNQRLDKLMKFGTKIKKIVPKVIHERSKYFRENVAYRIPQKK